MVSIIECIHLAVVCLLPDYQPPPPKLVTDYPAVMVIYDPSICHEPGGKINCDGDPTTVATGTLTPDMYFTAGACHPDLLGETIHFAVIDFSMECVDTGSMVTVDYNEYYRRDVVYFDVMWDSKHPPPWLYWLLEEWTVTWDN